MDFFTTGALIALLQVIAIDLVLAGDNAIVIGLAVAGVPAKFRSKAILIGIIAAAVLRIIFALLTVYLLDLVGLRLIGGLLLLWVCWKMWSELRIANAPAGPVSTDDAPIDTSGQPKEKTLLQAAVQIIIADISMSLDNVLAVAGAAADHPTVMVVGLIISIAMMGLAASYIAKLLNKYHWISYLGLAVIVYVAVTMLYHGIVEVMPYITG
jgi:YjbE family integral membrane protein